MIEQLLNIMAGLIVAYLYWIHKKSNKPDRIVGLKKALMIALLVLSVIILSASFTEFIRTHNRSGNGFDFAHAYVMRYGLFIIIIPFFWILQQALKRLQNSLISIVSYMSIITGTAGLYYFVVKEPSCLNEWDVCVYAEARTGAIYILILLFLFLLIEAYKYSKSIIK